MPAESLSAVVTGAWSPDSLEKAFRAIAEGLGGEVGVAVLHIESGRRAGWNGHRRLPMASVYKIPIAYEVLRRHDRRVLSLDDSLTVDPRDFVGGANPMTADAAGRAVTATVRRMLEYTVSESDNTASDALLRAVGGPPIVEARMRELGIDGIEVSRYEAEVFAQAQRTRSAGAAGVPADLGDHATPEALVELLAHIHRGATLAPSSRGLLLDWMTRTKVGPGRVRGLLPAGTPVAHKTGTYGSVTNDVAIVTLPDGTHLAIAVLIRAPGTGVDDRERAIAKIAREAYDSFLSSEPAAR